MNSDLQRTGRAIETIPTAPAAFGVVVLLLIFALGVTTGLMFATDGLEPRQERIAQ